MTELAEVRGCPLCYWLSRNRLDPPSYPLPAILNRMDSVIKSFMERFMNRDELPSWFPVKGTFLGPRSLSARDPESGLVLKGRLDAFLREKDGSYVVVDYKVSSPKEEVNENYKLQLDGYAYLLEKNGLAPVSKGVLLHFMPVNGDIADGRIPFDIKPVYVRVEPERIPGILGLARKIIDMKEPPPSSDDCEWCRWRREVTNLVG
ncbi:MAG: PD-(D/E)XK nuclease family protein [Candidatus Hadarchaeales archaeon]